MWAINTGFTIFVWLLVVAIFSFDPFIDFGKFWDIILKTVFALLFIIVILLEIKDWKSRNKEE